MAKTKDPQPGDLIYGAVAHDGTLLPPATEAPAETAPDQNDPAAELPQATSDADVIDSATPYADAAMAAAEEAAPTTVAPADQSLLGQDTTEGGDVPGADILPPVETVVTQGDLRKVIAEIEARNTDLHREQLMHHLVETHGMQPGDEGMSITMLGLTVTRGAASPGQVLTTWCSKARRAILSGEVPE